MPVETPTKGTMTAAAPLERPFYLIVVLWSARFREYFLEYCVPSLLAPGNLSALSTKVPSRFLIMTLIKAKSLEKAQLAPSGDSISRT